MQRRDFWQIHGRQSTVEAAVDADENTADDEQFIGAGHLAEAHKSGGDDCEDVVDQKSSFPAITNNILLKKNTMRFFRQSLRFKI